ncbi:MAG: hypothetical protein U5N21_12335 [Rhodococcus sp. (in: high G+C Gram-positive bacteria)]|nr:hypothetical protein [Rhodococcus sp. (in: high G+C Gram-positive bacteria)]
MPIALSPVLTFPHDAVAQITLSNPPVNALTRPATRRLRDVLLELADECRGSGDRSHRRPGVQCRLGHIRDARDAGRR